MSVISEFFRQLQIQRWDDHRYYHHSRINQTLHLVSAISFVCAYAWLFKDPATAALIAWLASEDCSFSTGGVFDISGGRATY